MSQGRRERLGGARGSEGEHGQHAMGDTRWGALGGAWLQEVDRVGCLDRGQHMESEARGKKPVVGKGPCG